MKWLWIEKLHAYILGRSLENNGWGDIRFCEHKTLKTFIREELVYPESPAIGDKREKAQEVINLKYIFETNLIELNDLLGEEN